MRIKASLDGVLSEMGDCFTAIQKQEKRILQSIQDRNYKFQDEDNEDGPSLRKEEIVSSLNNTALKLVNDNHRNRVDLLKFYTMVVLKREHLVDSVEENKVGEPEIDISLIRKELAKYKTIKEK